MKLIFARYIIQRGYLLSYDDRLYLENKYTSTVHGKILEGENFGELMALKSLARKNLANLLVVRILKILAFINIGGENFGKLPTIRQIRQNFPPPKFSHVRYL